MKNDEDRESVIERIKKLLAMTERAGCTQAEAVQAALMAQRLIVEHDVQERELRGAAEAEPIEEVLSDVRKRPGSWGARLAATVGAAFRCKVYVTKGAPCERFYRPAFFGHRSDAMAANVVFERLYGFCDRAAKRAGDAARKRRRKEAREMGAPGWFVKDEGNRAARRARESFALGFCEGARSELEKQSAALLVTVPQDVRDEHAKLKTSAHRVSLLGDPRSADFARGVDAGRDAVRSGRVGSGDGGAFALTPGQC